MEEESQNKIRVLVPDDGTMHLGRKTLDAQATCSVTK